MYICSKLRQEGRVRSLWIGMSLLVLAGSVSADTVDEIISSASENNETARIADAELDLAMRRYEGDLQTAETSDEVVSAELARISAVSARQSTTLGYYNSVIDAVFDLAVATLDLQASEINHEIANADLAYARARHESGVISSSDLTSAELDHLEETEAYAQAVFDEAEARTNFSLVTGLSWHAGLVPAAPGATAVLGLAAWIDADIPYQRARLDLTRAEIAADNPPGTASEYEQDSADIELESARLGVEQARQAAEADYRKIVRALESDWASLGLQRQRHALELKRVEVAELRFDRGLITESQRDQQRVQPLAAQARYLEAVRRYIKDVIALRLHFGISLDGI